MVPMLVVLLWILKAADKLPVIARRFPTQVSGAVGRSAAQRRAADDPGGGRSDSEIASGVVGLIALLFAVSKMFAYTERRAALIASSGQRTPKLSRALAYVALLLMPSRGARDLRRAAGAGAGIVERSAVPPAERDPGRRGRLGIALGFAALWLAVTLLYTAAARARIPFVSAAVGGGLAAGPRCP
jgi:hypothetical protein